MANKNRNKGNYHEKWFVNWLEKIGFKAKRQPLSGQLGGEYRGDIIWEVGGEELIVEIKYRDTGNFPSAFAVLKDRDVAMYKRKTGEPRTLVVIEGDIFERVFAPLLLSEGNTSMDDLAAQLLKKMKDDEPSDRKKLVPEDWQPSDELMNDINKKLGEELNHGDETSRFCDYHSAKGSKFVRIESAYRTWCRNSVKFRQESQSSGTFSGGRKPKYSGQKSSFFAGIHNNLSSD